MPAMRALLALCRAPGACALAHRRLLLRRGQAGRGCACRRAEAASAPTCRLAEPREQDRRARLLPGWLPDPLIGAIGSRWNNINSVSADRSYLESFVWQETGGGAAGGELHVNLRGYPGVTKIPTCRTGGADSRNVPCFADAARHASPRTGITRGPLHGQPGRRRSGTALLLWRAQRHPLHALRARRASADLRPRDPLPEAGARGRSSSSAPRRADEAHAEAGPRRRCRRRRRRDRDLRARRPARRRHADARRRRATALPEQHLLDGVRIVESDSVEVLVPPLHHEILTATLAVDRSDLRDAQRELAARARRARPRLRALARRARRDGRLGAPVLPAARARRSARATCRTTGAPTSR